MAVRGKVQVHNNAGQRMSKSVLDRGHTYLQRILDCSAWMATPGYRCSDVLLPFPLAWCAQQGMFVPEMTHAAGL